MQHPEECALQAGDYRRLLHRPSDLQWALLRYSDPDVPLNAPDAMLATGAAEPLQGADDLLLERGLSSHLALP